jgi:hypothetical protein
MNKKDFLSKIKTSEGCSIWDGYKTQKGYGEVVFEKKLWYAHRLSYFLNIGDIPEGKLVCHKCDNPACIKPDHLYIGDPIDNSSDMVKKGRSHKGYKLSDDDIKDILISHFDKKESNESLSKRYNISDGNVSLIVNGKRHINTYLEVTNELENFRKLD